MSILNLGMKHTQYEYIAFLDADDFYLHNRFKEARKVFESDTECEGVYGALGIKFENEDAKKRWIKSSMSKVKMTTMTEIVPPEQLFERLVLGGAGYFSICGLILKKSAMAMTGYMNEKLHMHEDTDFIIRISAVVKLLPGSLYDPVVIRRVHKQNRISEPRSKLKIYKDQMKMWFASYKWLHNAGLVDKELIIFNRMAKNCVKHKPLPFIWNIAI